MVGARFPLTGSGLIEVLVWAGATSLSAAASVAFAAAQGHRASPAHPPRDLSFRLLALGALFSVVGVAAGWFSLGLLDNVGIELRLIMIAASLLVLLISAVLAAIRLGQIRGVPGWSAAERW